MNCALVVMTIPLNSQGAFQLVMLPRRGPSIPVLRHGRGWSINQDNVHNLGRRAGGAGIQPTNSIQRSQTSQTIFQSAADERLRPGFQEGFAFRRGSFWILGAGVAARTLDPTTNARKMRWTPLAYRLLDIWGPLDSFVPWAGWGQGQGLMPLRQC